MTGPAKKARNREESDRAERRGHVMLGVGEGGQQGVSNTAGREHLENYQQTQSGETLRRGEEQESGAVRSPKARRDS